MTFWEQFVESKRTSARSIQEHASPGNLETQVTYEVLMAEADAAEKVLRRLAGQCDERMIEIYFGIPK